MLLFRHGGMLADTNWYVGTSALDALRQFGPGAKQAAPAVERYLSHTNFVVRASAMAALRAVDPDAAAQAGYSLSDLLRMVHDPNVDTRKTAVYSLYIAHDEASSVVPALIPALTDSDPRVRRLAVTTLRRYKHEAQSALPALTRCLKDPDEAFRESDKCDYRDRAGLLCEDQPLSLTHHRCEAQPAGADA